MKPACVHIATTEGPSAIQRITAEDPDVRSVVCLAGRAIALPISGDYDAFVRRPTGVVEACFGHGAYRIDISAPIAGGLSWQLGVFVAHALAAQGMLDNAADKRARIVWATGEITRDLTVEPVEDVALKIRRSEALFRAALDSDVKVAVLVPAANAAEAAEALTGLLGDDACGIETVAAATVPEALSAVGMRWRRSRHWLPRPLSDGASRRTLSRAALYGVSAALSLAAVATGWSRLSTVSWPPVATANAARPQLVSLAAPAPDRLSVMAVETRPSAGAGCAEVLFDVVPPRTVERSPEAAPVATADLCGFRYRVTNTTGGALSLRHVATRRGGQRDGFRVHASAPARLLPAGATIEIDARPPRRLTTPLDQSFVLFAYPSDVDASVAGLLAKAAGARSTAELTALSAEARRLGATVRTVRQDFVP